MKGDFYMKPLINVLDEIKSYPFTTWAVSKYFGKISLPKMITINSYKHNLIDVKIRHLDDEIEELVLEKDYIFMLYCFDNKAECIDFYNEQIVLKINSNFGLIDKKKEKIEKINDEIEELNEEIKCLEKKLINESLLTLKLFNKI